MADHPELTTPWGTHPGDKDDPNYGRVCLRCKGPIRAGLRHAHVCAPTHPETTALRLAEAATEGPWTAYRMVHADRGDNMTAEEVGTYTKHSVMVSEHESGSMDFLAVRCTKPDGGDADVGLIGNGPTSPANAAHIAHAHPGRVRAWLGAVARLRERAAEGHSSRCETQHYSPLQVARGEAAECDCGHDLDLAALAAVDAEG